MKPFLVNQKAAQLCHDLGDKRNLLSVLNSQGILYRNTGNLEQAYPLAVEQEKIARELGDQKGLASALVLQGVIEQERGKVDLALSRLREAEEICRLIGDKEFLHGTFRNRLPSCDNKDN